VILADTNVVSEFMRDTPAPAVFSWASTIAPGDLTMSVITVQEIEYGLRRLAHGRHRFALEERWNQLVDSYGDMIATYDIEAARAAAEILVHAERAGHPMGLADVQIAGICVARGYELATRNVRDFETVANTITITNPF